MLVRRLDELREEYTSLGERLTERIGVELVPHCSFSRKDRALALQVRRQLHNGRYIRESAFRQLAELARRLVPKADRLIDDLQTAARSSEVIMTLQARLSQVTIEEQGRLARLAWELVASSPLYEHLLLNRNPAFYAEMEERVRCGDSWKKKSLRRCGTTCGRSSIGRPRRALQETGTVTSPYCPSAQVPRSSPQSS